MVFVVSRRLKVINVAAQEICSFNVLDRAVARDAVDIYLIDSMRDAV